MLRCGRKNEFFRFYSLLFRQDLLFIPYELIAARKYGPPPLRKDESNEQIRTNDSH